MKDQEKWMVLSIIDDDKVRGYLFIHMFKNANPKTEGRSKRPKNEIPTKYKKYKYVLLIVLIGESKYVRYLKTQFEILSIKYPQAL
ncbi:MAG: hypothetical protein QXS32_01970 [Candidatus Nezhaarchaeales archaeon]